MRTCLRCGFTFPLEQFAPGATGYTHLCADCAEQNSFFERAAGVHAQNRLRLEGAEALLNMGYVKAAALVFADIAWPTIWQARQLQRAA